MALLSLLSSLQRSSRHAPGLLAAVGPQSGLWRGASSSWGLQSGPEQPSVDSRSSSGSSCSTSGSQGPLEGQGAWAYRHYRSSAAASAPVAQAQPGSLSPEYFVGLHNLRDNAGATKQRIRVGRGDSARRGNYCGRGMKGQKARSTNPHTLYDGGTLGMLKFPVSRERPPYEVLYNQLGLGRLVEYIQLGLLDTSKVITMKDLQDSGCVARSIKYGVMLYGKVPAVPVPIHIQVTACEPHTKAAIEAAGGTVTRVYYEAEGLRGLLHPEQFKGKKLPLPLPAHSWHPRHDGKFDAIGHIPPAVNLPASAPST